MIVSPLLLRYARGQALQMMNLQGRSHLGADKKGITDYEWQPRMSLTHGQWWSPRYLGLGF